MSHFYTAYGLVIESELECPELLVAERTGRADVRVTLADIPPRIASPRHTTPRVQVGDGVFQFEPPGVARYRVSGGHTILVRPLPGTEPEDVRLHLLGTAFGALLHQQGRLPLHASAVEWEGGVVAFCGNSGAGKSTLAAALHRRGYSLLCDDVGVVVPCPDGAPLFYPGFPRIKLWRDALDHFQVDPSGLTPDWTRADKFHFRLQDLFQHRPLPLRTICFLERGHDDAPAEVRPLSPADGVPWLIENTFRPGLVRWLGDMHEHIRRCARIAESVSLCRYRRPWSLAQLDDSLDVLVGASAVVPPAGTARVPAHGLGGASR